MINLLRIISIARKLTATSNNTIKPVQFFRTSTHRKEWDNKVNEASLQVPNSNEFTSFSNSNLYAFNKLNSCSSINEIFQFVNEREKNMKGYQVVHILEILKEISSKDYFRYNQITASSEFSTLCNVLKRDIRKLSEREIIKALNILIYYKVPSSTIIVQMLLQILRESINNLSLRQLLFLKFILEKCQKTPLVEALSISIPIILNANVKTQLYGEDADTLVKLLKHFCSISHDPAIISSIVNAINNIDESSMTTSQAESVIQSIDLLDCNDSNLKLLRKCQQVIINSVDKLTAFQITNVVRNICFNNRKPELYNERLIDACITTIISQDMGINAATNVLSHILKFRHTNNALLDYIGAKCLKINNLEQEVDKTVINTFIYGMSFSDYKPVFWESLKNVILMEKLLHNSILGLISLSNFLASLDCYWPPLLRKIYTMNHVGLSRNTLRKLHLSYKIVKLKYPEYDGPWPSDKLINVCESLPIFFQQKPTLKSALENALGGSQYIINNAVTSFGYFINHVVLMRKGGFPIAVNNINDNTVIKIEDLKLPPDSQIIFFICISERGIAINTQRPSGHWSLIVRLIESHPNHTVILIQEPIWEKMTEPERIRYISKAIRLKCDELSAAVIS